MSEDVEAAELELTLPDEFVRAPAWARALAVQQRRDRHHFGGELQKLAAAQHATTTALGQEPSSDGTGGTGLIGDVRRLHRDLGELMGLKNKGVGFVGAVVLFSALIIAGIIHWVQSVAGPAK